MRITVLGREVRKPRSVLEMIDALIIKAEKGTLSCCAEFSNKFGEFKQSKACMYRKGDNACFIGQFIDDGMEGLDYFGSVEDIIGEENTSWAEHFKDFSTSLLMKLQSIHDEIPDEMAKEKPSIQSEYYLEALKNFREEIA